MILSRYVCPSNRFRYWLDKSRLVLTSAFQKIIILTPLRAMADAITNLPHPGKVVRRKAM